VVLEVPENAHLESSTTALLYSSKRSFFILGLDPNYFRRNVLVVPLGWRLLCKVFGKYTEKASGRIVIGTSIPDQINE
jgi:myo-inositol catabolism protein IolC